MENVFSMVLYLIYGFLGLLAVLFVLAMLFGKRIRKQWEFEAEFRDAAGREFGELDIESSRIEKEGPWGVRILYRYHRNDGILEYDRDLLPDPWPKKVYIENGVIIAYQEFSAAHDPGCFAFRTETCFDFDGVVSTEKSDALMR